MTRRAAAGETGDGEIETAPEEMHRARLAEETGAELLEHAVGIDEDLQKTPHRIRVIGCVPFIVRKSDGIGQLVRNLVDDDVNVELRERSQYSGVETGDRMPGEQQMPRRAVTG